jgi:3-oxoacyl-[acyl-carrier-protein] synthase III
LYADGHHSDILEVDNAQMSDHTKHLNHLAPTDNCNRPVDELYPFVKMKGKNVFRHAVKRLGELVREIQDDPMLKDEPIDWLVPHQANIRIIKATADKLKLTMDKVICTVDTHANTSSASIGLAMDAAVRDGRIQRGQNVLFEAFGAGLTWGSAFVKY